MDWGKDCRLLKAYYVFRQWCQPLSPGMRVVETVGAVNIRTTAFLLADNQTLVVHIANGQNHDVPLTIRLAGAAWANVGTGARVRTSAREDAVALPNISVTASQLHDVLPRSLW